MEAQRLCETRHTRTATEQSCPEANGPQILAALVRETLRKGPLRAPSFPRDQHRELLLVDDEDAQHTDEAVDAQHHRLGRALARCGLQLHVKTHRAEARAAHTP